MNYSADTCPCVLVFYTPYVLINELSVMFLFFILLNLYDNTMWQLAFFLFTCATPYMVLLFKTSNIKY